MKCRRGNNNKNGTQGKIKSTKTQADNKPKNDDEGAPATSGVKGKRKMEKRRTWTPKRKWDPSPKQQLITSLFSPRAGPKPKAEREEEVASVISGMNMSRKQSMVLLVYVNFV